MLFVTPVLPCKYRAEESGPAGSQGDGSTLARVGRCLETWADPKGAPGAGAALSFLAALLKDTQHTHSGLQQPGFHFDLGSEGRRDPLSGNNAVLREK